MWVEYRERQGLAQGHSQSVAEPRLTARPPDPSPGTCILPVLLHSRAVTVGMLHTLLSGGEIFKYLKNIITK